MPRNATDDDIDEVISIVSRQFGHSNRVASKLSDSVKAGFETAENSLAAIKANGEKLGWRADSALIGDALAGVGEGSVRAALAFSNNRPMEGSAELIRLVGSAAKLSFLLDRIGKTLNFAGPIGIVISEMLNMVSAIISAFAPLQKPMIEQLKGELLVASATLRIDDLAGVLDQLAIIHADLIERKPDSLTWDAVNRTGQFAGQNVISLGAAESWLERETTAELWPTVLKSWVIANNLRLQNLLIGIQLVHKFENGKPTDSYRPALSVLTEISDQTRGATRLFRPLALAHETIWYTRGGDGRIFKQTIHGDQPAGYYYDRMTLGSDGRRTWLLDKDGRYGTWLQGSGDGLGMNPLKHDVPGPNDIYMARKADSNIDCFVAVEWGNVVYREYEESKPPPKSDSELIANFKKDARPPYKTAPVDPGYDPLAHAREAAITPDGALYVISDKDELWLADSSKGPRKLAVLGRNAGKIVPYPKLVDVDCDDKHVFVCSDKVLWYRSHRDVEADGAWTKIEPGQTYWVYMQLYVKYDGTLLAVIDEVVHAWNGTSWKQVDGPRRARLAIAPVDGWGEFLALEETVEEIVKNREDLAKKAPALPASAAVSITPGGFSPNVIKIGVNGKVTWTWTGSGNEHLTSKKPLGLFDTDKPPGGTFEHIFTTPGEYLYSARGKDGVGAVLVLRS
jgi:plastocyanin